jgi:hypothetical protein
MKQTAVEQFAIALYEKFKLEGNGKELNDLVEQAKEIKKMSNKFKIEIIEAPMINETKQTAVEWLASELSNHLEMPHKYFIEILDQAKEMEKQQTEQAKLDAKEIIIIKHTEHEGSEQ